MLELTKFNDSTFSGKILTKFWVGENMERKEFTQNLSEDSAEYVFEALTANGINNLDYCNNCGGVMFMDGLNINFKFYENNKFINRIGYDEIYPSQNNRMEENPIRRKAQILIDIIEENIGMQKHFSTLIGELHDGSYSWWMGNGTVTYKIPN